MTVASFTDAYGPAESRVTDIQWRTEMVHGYGLHLPAGWELEIDEKDDRGTMVAAPDLSAFVEEHARIGSVIATTGVLTRSFNLNSTYKIDEDLLESRLRRELSSQRFRNCNEHEAVVILNGGGPYPNMGFMRFYSCDNGYQLVDTIRVDSALRGRAMHVRLVGTRAELQYLIHIPDSVRRLDG